MCRPHAVCGGTASHAAPRTIWWHGLACRPHAPCGGTDSHAAPTHHEVARPQMMPPRLASPSKIRGRGGHPDFTSLRARG